MYKEKFGRIINLSSISASYAKRGQANYAAAKAGIEGFTRTLALEVAHRGVTVNAIAPGLIETKMTRELVAKIEAGGGSIRDGVPARRMGSPDEIGALAQFLCSSDASYITGTVITIDGGRSLGDPKS
jgi:3-oxoacyl-[acyl-carrier protein] reductase